MPCDDAHTARGRAAAREIVRAFGLLRGRAPEVDCPISEGHALVEIGGAGVLTVQEIADRLHLSRSATSRLVGRLRRRGWVTVGDDARDGRIRLARLSARGKTQLRRLDEYGDGLVREALRHVSASEHTVAALEEFARGLHIATRRRGLIVRPLRRSDNRAIVDVLRSVRREHGVAPLDRSYVESEELDLFQFYAERGAYFVVQDSGDVGGGAGIGPLRAGDPDTCELQKMYLLPGLRGLGLGSDLVVHCLEAAERLGYRRCYLETMDFMHAARRLYERHGFEPLPEPLGATGHTFSTAWYVRPLDGSRSG